jgi:hypothetical protein
VVENKVSQDFVYLGLALAVFAVGLQYIPIEYIPKFLIGRKPTKKDSIMIRKILGILASLAFLVIIYEVFAILIHWGVSIANSSRLANDSLCVRDIKAIICVATIVILLDIIGHVLWKASKNEEIEPSENEKLITKTGELAAKLDELIDVLKQNAETKVKGEITSKKLDTNSVEKPNETTKK